MRPIEYKNILSPSVDFLQTVDTLFLDVDQMAQFLGVGAKTVKQLVFTNRIPVPVRLGFVRSLRWSVLELAEWVEAGCPGRDRWIEMRGHSGWIRHHKRGF